MTQYLAVSHRRKRQIKMSFNFNFTLILNNCLKKLDINSFIKQCFTLLSIEHFQLKKTHFSIKQCPLKPNLLLSPGFAWAETNAGGF